MYSFSSNVRFSECGEDRRLSLTSLVDYFQDCSVFHTQSTTRTMEALTADGRAWMISAWHIEVDTLPRLGDEVIVSTWEYAYKGLYANRNFALSDAEGEPLARADSRWFLMDFNAGRPIRIPREEIEEYDEGEVGLDMGLAPKHLVAPEGGTTLAPIEVSEFLLDSNHHVNNARYIELALSATEPQGVSEIDVVYRHAATLGDSIVPRVVADGGKTYVELASAAGEAYSVVRFA